MTKTKKFITLFLGISLISLTPLGVSPTAKADGVNQVATHFDWNGVSLSPTAAITQSFTPLAVP